MKAIVINEQDSVAVALQDLASGESITLNSQSLILQDNITRGHKFALREIAVGEPVLKYGFAIGTAKEPIQIGQHVHNHNVKTALSAEHEYSYNKLTPVSLPKVDAYFEGYERENGEVGIRNEIWIIPTVFCVNNLARALERYGNELLKEQGLTNVEACIALTHPYGCSQMGEDQLTTQRLLAALTKHPNCGGVLLLGLGCENNNLQVFKDFVDLNRPNLVTLNTQDVEDEMAAGEKLVSELITGAAKYQRKRVPLSKLRIGLKCGGSDGLSGITANPLIGRLSDIVVGSGGTSVMTEVPEMFGAEQLLMNRACDQATFEKCVQLINNFKHYFISHGQVVSENPSPGNKAGGITTLEDKSLGCVQKGGKAPVSDVLSYADTIHSTGLNLLQAPGNDGVSCTALAAAGCHMILFSTGRGTPFATVVPTIKISTNSEIAKRKSNWIDFNAGAIADGSKNFETLTTELLDYVITVASGRLTKSEYQGFHEIVIWKDGVTM